MSINPLLTNFGPNASLFAPASGGGGGGGGPNLVASTLTINGSTTDREIFWDVGGGAGPYFSVGQVDTAVGSNLGAVIVGNNPAQSWYNIGCGDIYVAGSSVTPGSEVAPVLTSLGAGELIVKNSINVSSITVSSINGAAPGGGSYNPNLALSTLTMNGAISLANNTINLDTGNTAALYFNAGNNNSYLTGRSNAVVAIGTQANATALQVGDTSINMPTAVYMTAQPAIISTLTTNALTVGTVNGGVPYTTSNPPPAPAAPSLVRYNWIPEQQTIGSGTLPNILNYSTITPSPVFSSINGFTLSGSLTCFVKFQGSGNTNPVTNVAGTSNASFGLYMILDNSLLVPLTSLSFTTPNNTSPAGQYNSLAPSYNNSNTIGSFIVQPNYNFNSPTVSPGVEFTFTQFGAHTFQLFAWTDLFMASADPTANYATVLRFPASGDFGSTGLLVQTF